MDSSSEDDNTRQTMDYVWLSKKTKSKIVLTEDGIPVRKLYFSKLHVNVKVNTVHNYFKKYGDIDNVQINKKATYACGFVQFSSPVSAAKALKMAKHRIGRNTIKVVAANSWNQPTAPVEPHEAIGISHSTSRMVTRQSAATAAAVTAAAAVAVKRIYMDDLNEDCLLEVFKHLGVVDLSAIAQTCTRFQAIAQNIFTKKHRIFDFDDREMMGVMVPMPYTLHTIRHIMKSFGKLIIELNISPHVISTSNKRRIANLLERHCVNLKSLRLHDFFFTKSCASNFGKVFSRLTELSLDECETAMDFNIIKLMKCCGNLESLKLGICGKLGNQCITVIYPKLKSFTFRSLYTDDENLYSFFEKHRQLRGLKIIRSGYLADDVFEQIAINLKELESLSIVLNGFESFVQSLDYLLTLDHLRELKLNCSLYSIAGFVNQLAAKETIEVLHITDGVLNEQLIEALVKCKKLTSLKLGSMPNVHDRFLVELGKNLPLLTELHLSKCQTMTLNGLINLVRHAPKLERLYLNKSIIQFTNEAFMEMVELCQNRGPLQICSVQRTCYVQSSHGVSKALIDKHSSTVSFVRIDEHKYDDIDEDDDSLDDSSDYNDSEEDFFWGNFGSDEDLLLNNYEDFQGVGGIGGINAFNRFNYYDVDDVEFFLL